MISNQTRIVVKVGSSTIFDSVSGQIRQDRLVSIVKDIRWLTQDLDKDVVLMSSGALATGREKLKNSNLKVKSGQILGAVGQIDISYEWAKALKSENLIMGQLLLTPEALNKSSIVASTIEDMLQNNIIPYINENIPVMNEYDNDGLAAKIAQSANCDLLVLLSDVDGVYTANPMTDENAQKIDVIEDIDAAIEKYGGGASSGVGTGGMYTKLAAAKLLADQNTETIIGSGEIENPVRAIVDGSNGTLVKI